MFATHELKVLFIICSTMFDMQLVDEAGHVPQGELQPDTRSAGVSRLGGKYSLRMSRRKAQPA